MTSNEPAHEPDRAPSTTNSTTLVLKCAVAILLSLLVAGVALAFAGWREASIIGLLTAVGSVAGGLLVILPRLVNMEHKVDQVARQTNGELRKHVSQAVATEVRAALAEHLGPPPDRAPSPAKRRTTR